MTPVNAARQKVIKAIRWCLLAAGTGVVFTFLVPVPPEQKVLYLAGSLALTLLCVLALLQLLPSGPDEESR